MSVRINLGKWCSVFAVPSCVVDEHIKIASPLQLKILLYLLRNSEKTISVDQLGEFFSSHTEDVKDAIDFWIERGVICQNNDELKPSEGVVEDIKEESVVEEKQESKKTRRTVTRITNPNLLESAQRVAGNPDLKNLLSEVECILSKPISSGDTAILVMLYDTCGLPAEVIIMLAQYCVSIDKGNFRTIQRIGVEWSDNGIDTLEKAENRIQQVKQANENWSKVRGVFGLKNTGSPTKKQLEYAQQWVEKWHFSSEMLRTAYEMCVDNTGELSMPYINKILKRWYSAGVFKIEDIEKLDNKKVTKKTSKAKASYDIDELEKIQ